MYLILESLSLCKCKFIILFMWMCRWMHQSQVHWPHPNQTIWCHLLLHWWMHQWGLGWMQQIQSFKACWDCDQVAWAKLHILKPQFVSKWTGTATQSMFPSLLFFICQCARAPLMFNVGTSSSVLNCSGWYLVKALFFSLLMWFWDLY
jgi:hypothetical protein